MFGSSKCKFLALPLNRLVKLKYICRKNTQFYSKLSLHHRSVAMVSRTHGMEEVTEIRRKDIPKLQMRYYSLDWQKVGNDFDGVTQKFLRLFWSVNGNPPLQFTLAYVSLRISKLYHTVYIHSRMQHHLKCIFGMVMIKLIPQLFQLCKIGSN